MNTKYKRVLLKLSGEALAGDKGFGLDETTLDGIAATIKDCVDLGVQIAVVVVTEHDPGMVGENGKKFSLI